MSKKIRLAGIAYESLVNGPGMRRVYFSQGCRHNCEGCFNPDTHDFNGGEERDMDELIEDALDNPLLKGITFSGMSHRKHIALSSWKLRNGFISDRYGSSTI